MSSEKSPIGPIESVRLVVCDDHVVVRAGLMALLASAPGIEVIGEAGSGEEAVALAGKLAPDVVLMDLQLGPGIDGVEATRRITGWGREDGGGGNGSGGGSGSGGDGGSGGGVGEEGDGQGGGAPRVLVLTTYDTDADITRAIEAGATGYLLKAERPEELFAAIHAAAQGRTALSPPVASRVMARMREPQPTLTPRELDILGRLAQGMGNREIARTLFISEATVKTHLGRMYEKLGVDTRAGAVAVAKERRLLP
ncbi:MULTISPECIES: response regulator [Streptomyces]|uniref:LuxR family transcriptional regulator n=2 Tax=Streptomyces TaxID=1883 RepID=A0A0W7XA07_9ACTN|nr:MULTISPECIES: response regulator transcription factor [Streptomyces]KUF19798.1 LuxR family transcriptional regulator [Streptomyces silvensis]MVO87878.1 response regulator [Streptomyces typhae]